MRRGIVMTKWGCCDPVSQRSHHRKKGRKGGLGICPAAADPLTAAQFPTVSTTTLTNNLSFKTHSSVKNYKYMTFHRWINFNRYEGRPKTVCWTKILPVGKFAVGAGFWPDHLLKKCLVRFFFRHGTRTLSHLYRASRRWYLQTYTKISLFWR